MKKLLVAALLLLTVSASLLSGCVSQKDYDSLLKQLQTTQAEATRLNTDLYSLRSELDSTKAAVSVVQTDLTTTKNTLKSTQAELKSTKEKLDSVESQLKQYKETLGISVFSGIQPPYSKVGTDPTQRILLANNAAATDPTWAQLVAFILKDQTDTKPYINNVFMCGAYAEEVHNNAEKAGIRTALVTIDFKDNPVGHALNAFRTSDKGLVYVDSTGKGLTVPTAGDGFHDNWDKVAYVVKDKEYGLVGFWDNDGTDYAFYEQIKKNWDDYRTRLDEYNADVKKYNMEINGKIFYIGTADWTRIKQWESRLNESKQNLSVMRAGLRPLYNPLGTVNKIEIYW